MPVAGFGAQAGIGVAGEAALEWTLLTATGQPVGTETLKPGG
jgi:hypothetical protein